MWQMEVGRTHSADMSKYLKFGIIEDIDTVRHIPLGKFWNVTEPFSPVAFSVVSTFRFYSYFCFICASLILSLSSPKYPRPLPVFLTGRSFFFLEEADMGLDLPLLPPIYVKADWGLLLLIMLPS